MDEQLLKGHLQLLVLGLLDEEPAHGYALAKRIKDRADGKLRLGEGTLYPLLYRLANKGWIRSCKEIGPTGKERKVYSVTRAGKRQLEAGRADWRELSWLMREFLGENWGKA